MGKKTEKGENFKGFDLSKYGLNDTERNVFKSLIQSPEIKQGILAQQIGINQKHFSRIKAKPEFKRAYEDFKKQDAKSWIQILIDARQHASNKLIEHIDSENPTISIRAIENVLQLDKLDLSQTEDEESPY